MYTLENLPTAVLSWCYSDNNIDVKLNIQQLKIQHTWLAYFETSLFFIDFLALCRTLPQTGYRVWTLSVRPTKETSPPHQCMAKITVSIATQATSSLATAMGKQRSKSNLEILK